MAWYKNFVPDLMIKCYQDLTLSILQQWGCQVLAVDIDNTLVAYHQAHPDEGSLDFLKKLQAAGIEVVLISNNSKKRVATFCRDLSIRAYASAKKPLPFLYRRLLKDLQIEKNQLVCLGDQLLTDVLGAKLAKVKVIWCEPLTKVDIPVTRINRVIEKQIYKKLVRKGLLSEKV